MRTKILKILFILLVGCWAQDVSAARLKFLKDNPDGTQTLTSHVPPAVASSKRHHRATSTETMDLRVVLPLKNQTQLSALLKGLYDPRSPLYQRFLSPKEFKDQFAPSASDIDQVKIFFKAKGFTVKGQSGSGTILHLSAPVAAVERTLGSRITYYKKNSGEMFFAPESNPVIPAQIAGKVAAIGGLDNEIKFRPRFRKSQAAPIQKASGTILKSSATTLKSSVTALKSSPATLKSSAATLKAVTPSSAKASGQVQPRATGTGPGGYLAPADVRTAYGFDAMPVIDDLNSQQNVAIIAFDGYYETDIDEYRNYFSLPEISLQNVLIGAAVGTPDGSGGNVEVAMDIEQIIGISTRMVGGTGVPSVDTIYVYQSVNSIQGWIDQWQRIADDNLAQIVSCSWGMPEPYAYAHAPMLASDDAALQQMAAQGQSAFVASGDYGAYDCEADPTVSCTSTTLAVDEPSAQPFITGVGISILSANPDWTYASEEASMYSGGGISWYSDIPDYQVTMASRATEAAAVSQTKRNVPDVALTADWNYASSAYAFYVTDPTYGAGWYGIGGSSASAPAWASFIALVNQGRVYAGRSVLGFANPALYAIAENSSRYATDFHDIQVGSNQYYNSDTGFDNATGLGSLNAANLYTHLLTYGLEAPAAPTGLTATPGNALVSLSWNASSGATSYNVKRATVSGGSYTVINEGATSTSYIDSPLSNGTTYYYVVSAVSDAGEGDDSVEASATPSLPTVPDAPTGLVATAGDGQVALTWDASSGATSYTVKRSETSGGAYDVIASLLPGRSYTDSSVTNGTTYYYVVSATNAQGEGDDSTEASATPNESLPPLAPTELVATAGNGQVSLSWTASSGATSYTVKRSTSSGGPYDEVESWIMGTSYTDTFVVNGTTYYYVVSASNDAGEGSDSLEDSATPSASLPPAAPTGLAATAGDAQVALTWNVTPGATAYTVKRSTVSGSGYVSVHSGITLTNYTDTSVTNGTTYYYVVSASNASGEGENSSEVSATPTAPPPPAAPTGLTATAGDGEVLLTWNPRSGATSYTLKRSTDSGGPYSVVAGGITGTSYTDTSVTNGTTYYYVVSASNASGEGADSSEVSATPMVQPPGAPTGLVATGGNHQVALSWNPTSGATSYTIRRSTSSGGPYVDIVSGITGTTYTDTNVTNGTTYYYVVAAVNEAGAGPNSSEASATPLLPGTPDRPTGLSGTAGYKQVTLTWAASAGALTYQIKRARVSGGPYVTVAGAIRGTTYTDYSVDNGIPYYYIVTAINYIAESLASAEIMAIPGVAVPSVPTGLAATTGYKQVALTWTASTGATYYEVKRSTTSGGTYVTVGGSATASYTDRSVSNGTTYYYIVSAMNLGGASSSSAEISATPGVTVPATPSAFTATAGILHVALSWTASSGATSYQVKRSLVSGGPYVAIAGGFSSTNYVDRAVSRGVTYYYVVSAISQNVQSANSSEASGTVP